MDHIQIAEASGIPVETVTWYDAVFFHVTPRLKQPDWIMTHVLHPAAIRSTNDNGTEVKIQQYANPYLDWTLKLFAYYGGPLTCDFLITGFRQNQLSSEDDIHGYLDRCFSDKIRLRSAQACNTFKIDRSNVMSLFDVHSRLIESAKNVKPGQSTTATVQGMLEIAQSIPWTVGEVDPAVYKEAPVANYDKTAAELPEHEMLQVAAGETSDFLTALPELSIDNRLDAQAPGGAS